MTKISVGGKYLINNCREVKNRYFVFISASQQELRHNVEAIAEDALGLSAVFEDADVVEPLQPVLTHELAIRQQAVDALRTEEPDIALYQLYPLLRVGGALLRQYAEQQRVGHPVAHHGQHKDVDVGAAELSIGPVYGQTKRAFIGSRRKMTRAMRSLSRSNSAKKRWILRKHDEDFAGESKTVNKRLKHTVLTLHRATINSDMSLMCAKLMFFFKKELSVSDN